MEFLLNFCYYTTLFLIPIALYSLFLKNNNQTQFSTNKDWFYVIKIFFATVAIRRYQKKCKKSLDDATKKSLEKPKEMHSEKYNDSHFIYGTDQNGNSLSLRITIRSGLVAEVFLSLRLETGTVYTFPGEKSLRLYRVSSLKWKIKNLHVEILEPFKKLRITYNGLLSNANRNVEHVQFNFIWISAGTPKFYPQDATTGLFADALAREIWKDGDWISLLGDERGYEQFGALRGFIRGDSFVDDLQLNLPSCRTRFWGTAEKLAVERYVHLFVAGKDGTLLSIWTKALKNGCSRLKYGSVIMNNGRILAVTDSDVRLECLGQHGSLPSTFIVHIQAQEKVYKIIFHLNTKTAVEARNDEKRGYVLTNVSANCDLNTLQAQSLVEFWYSHKGTNVDLPPPLLVENKTKILPKSYVTSFNDKDSEIVRLTGGKGCSLALLASLKSDDFIVPDGFIVTVNSFNKQLEVNFNMKKAVVILDDICCGRTKGNLEQACIETVKTFKNEEILPEITTAILKAIQNVKNDELIITKRWAVRSSAVGEDSEELSAAGQNETFLGCKTPDEVIKSISSCWASLFTYQSVQYRHKHGLPVVAEMAVVVQLMVPADCAGVLFTYHPVTANPAQIVITANHGLGESVVSGKSEPDTVILQRTFDNDLTIASKSIGTKNKMIKMTNKGIEEQDGLEDFSITDNQALDLGKVGVFIEETFGGGRDIEWAYYQGTLFLLQSRPVTTLNSWTDFELLHEFDVATLTDDLVYTIANAGEILPGAIPVLSLTTVVSCIDKAIQKNVNNEIDRHIFKCLPTFQHHIFVDVIASIHQKVSKTITLQSKVVDLAIFGHPIINDTIHSLAIKKFGTVNTLQTLKDTIESIKYAWKNEENLKEIKNYGRNIDVGIDIDRDTMRDMYIKIDSFIEKLTEVLRLHCAITRTSITYQIIAMILLAEQSQDFNIDHYNDIAMLLSSCDDVISAEIPAILEHIAQILIQNDIADEFIKIDPKHGYDWLQINCPQASKTFEKFLEDHGHRALREFDISKETWVTNSEEVIKMIQTNCKKTGPLQEKTKISIDDVVKNLISPKQNSTRKILKFIMKRGRRAVGAREHSKSESIRFVNKLRIAYKQLARKMALHGLLPDEKLVFHLSHYEIDLLIQKDESSPTLISKALRRQKLYFKWDKLRFPEIVYGIPEQENDNLVITGKMKCEGTPVCTGVVKGRACVITDLSQIHQLKDGDILITYCTDIGWSPYFPMLSGIVTELGGLVSHGAVIAREYGLPCIVGVKAATKTFKTGDIVVLSGKTGTIELIE